MARIVRKVSNKATKGQKKSNLIHSKKFWIIIISVLVVLIAAGITIGVIVANNQKKDTTVEVDDYFGTTQKFGETDVNFTKMTYQGVRLHTNPEEGDLFNDYTFIFATSLASFYPEELKDADNNDLKDSKHEGTFKNLIQLQYEIDKYNALDDAEYKLALYIVNTDQVDGNSSYNIYSDSKIYGSGGSDSLGPLFTLVYEDGIAYKANGKSIRATDFYEDNSMISAIETAINLVKNKKFDQLSNENK